VRPAYEEVYGVKPGQFPARATATDVFITAVGSCMIGAFSRGAEARGLEVLPGRLSAVIESNIAKEPGGIRYVERIHVQLHTHFGKEHKETLERVFQGFERRCWLGQTLVGSRCTVTSELVIGDPAE
jgi:organic hydroperoxide reductase OsmC/OhrA